jgi:hypothetical protein
MKKIMERTYSIMQRINFMYKQFLKEPWWLKILVVSTFLISIIFSGSLFSNNGYYQSAAKLAGPSFFAHMESK